MPFIKCSVGGCSRRLQPMLKVDPRDRNTWLYPECEECGRPVCDEHVSVVSGRAICERCRLQIEDREVPVLQLGLKFRTSD